MNQQIKQRIEQINNGQVPEGYKKTEFGIFPCDWVTDKTLDKVCQINPKTNCLPKQFIYLDLESVQDRKIIQKNIINIENAPSRAQRVLSKDDIIYQLVRPYQKNNLFFNVDDEQYPTVASTGYGLLRSKMQNYLFQIIHADYFVNQVNVKCTGTNYPAINSDDLGKVLIAFPQSKNEQDKIAEILMKWDEAIVLYNRQIEKLKQLKSVCIKKMFPKKRSKVPEVRFKGFTKDWEQRKLGDVATEMVAGGDIDKDLILDEGRYPVIANALTNDGIVGYYNEDYRIKAPAVTITGRGDVGHAKARIVDFTPVVRLLSLKSNHDVFFLENAINTLKIVIESTGVPQLTVPQLAKYEISFPKSLDEEEKIGVYFNQLDDLITLHQRKLEKIKIQQKALQQYLLNGIVRVDV